MAIVVCRARIIQGCHHGRTEQAVYERESMRSDGTWDGRSVICTPCYAALLPYTPDEMGLLADLPQAIRLYKDAHRPMEERIERFTQINEATEGVKVLREDLPDGAVKLVVFQDGAPEAAAVLTPGRPIRWM